MQLKISRKFAVIGALAAVIIIGTGAFITLRTDAQSGAPTGGQGAGRPAFTNEVAIDVGSVAQTVNATGNIVPAGSSDLTFDASGIVRVVNVQIGQAVQAGETLAIVDDSNQQAAVSEATLTLQAATAALNKILAPVDANTIALADSTVKSAQASLQSKAASGNSAATIAAYQAKVVQAQSDRDYAYKLLNDAGGRYQKSDPNYQLALAQAGQADFALKTAQLNLQEAQKGTPLGAAQANIAYAKAKLAQTMAGPVQSDIDIAQAQVVQAQLQLDQAREQLAKTQLKAPYAGVITVVNAKVGQPTQGVAFTLTDLSKLYVDIKVDEADIVQIKPDQTVSLTADALPGATFTAKVDRVYPIADATASVITYPVHLLLDATTQPLRVGMTVNASFTVQQVNNVVRVANNYVKVNRTTGQSTVSLVDPNTATLVTVNVKTGLIGTDYTEIINGLTVGDNVALPITSTTGSAASAGGFAGGAGGFPGGAGGFPGGGGRPGG